MGGGDVAHGGGVAEPEVVHRRAAELLGQGDVPKWPLETIRVMAREHLPVQLACRALHKNSRPRPRRNEERDRLALQAQQFARVVQVLELENELLRQSGPHPVIRPLLHRRRD
ncbi:hypothetical protein [Streptomyces sp. MMG1533]|uniref:hypothetical protein n=1 Tax=Streptomyces sp. MMG1533 TaxID=1415546 RepID=UPI00131A9BC5|nr:hypothetical protein [Streptomyces sp. MMG1533]